MQVILKPVSQPELGEILINDDLFPIGRHEAPFASYEPRVAEKLSRRHARIFEQDGVVYIADLGSLNGTTVNGTGVTSLPVRLKRGDQICFTGSLCYEIEILGAAAKRPVEDSVVAPVQLVLTPEHQALGLEPVVITRFPFLVSKASDVFSRYRDKWPKEVSYISSRHAHLFLRGGDIYVEDLGSTNGTFVSGERLEEHARKLGEGDRIAFGGNHFAYRVGLLHAAAEATGTPEATADVLTGTSHTVDDVTRTTFVTSANSFLDIFYVDESDSAVLAEVSGQENRNVDDVADRAPVTRKLLQGPRTILHELREAFFDRKKSGRGRTWLAAAVIAGLALLGIYWSTAPEREIHRLLDTGEYAAAASAANRYLEETGDNQEIRDIATEATLKQTVPDWLDRLAAAQFDAAMQLVSDGERASYANPDGQAVYGTLKWATELERFVAERGGIEKPVMMFSDEAPIRQLVDDWSADPKSHRRQLATVVLYVPEFAAEREQLFSHLRALQNHQSLSLAAIERLRDEFSTALEHDRAASLGPVLDKFEQTYPRIQGVGKLRSDLEKYLLIDARLKGNYWIEAHQLASQTRFETPLFREHMQLIARQQLPSQDTVDRYKEARTQWLQGHSDTAITILEPLVNERWGEVAERRLARYRQVADDYRKLSGSRQQADYDRRLLAFYRTLDPQEDVYFKDAVEEEFQVNRDKALGEVERLVARASESWRKYRDAGGIRGQHRLAASVSSAYRQRAAELSSASRYMNEAEEIIELLNVAYRDDWRRLNSEISKEIRLQRQALAELEMVLEPSLRQAKLGLLPLTDVEHPVNGRD